MMQEDFEEELVVPLKRMEYGVVGETFVLLRREPGTIALAKLSPTLQFTVKEIDPSSGDNWSPFQSPYCAATLKALSCNCPVQSPSVSCLMITLSFELLDHTEKIFL